MTTRKQSSAKSWSSNAIALACAERPDGIADDIRGLGSDVGHGAGSGGESGQKPGTAATLKKIADALRITVDDLI
ncbi:MULTISPECIES: hypothetical protein [unclassified Bradyrhizobium]|uniref:hypothetical protein n=1 Tax=unclassified Bradyrhizobium TaxID=2631580 RepID=UPI0024E13CC4|nr:MULTISPECIES: hypothetical protein [unclassified Bradyrhizobium]